jgi:hypothetical protein
MEIPELIMNSNIIPVYITATNVVTPLITIDSVYAKTIIIFNMLVNILQISIQTAFFIIKELFVEAYTKMTVVKMVYIIVIYNLFMLSVIDSHQRKLVEQKKQIEILEKKLRHLKNREAVRDDFEQLWINDIKSYNKETTKKMTSMEKKIKKIEKEFI